MLTPKTNNKSPKTMNDTRITFFPNIVAIDYYSVVPFFDAIDIIKHPTSDLKKAVGEIRKTKDHTTQNMLKVKTLGGFCFSGVFTSREDSALQEYSPLICIDLDNVQDIPTELKRIKTFPYVASVFLSPSGTGLKVVVLHDNLDPNYHKELYHSIGYEMGFTGRSDLVFDLSCSNLSRFCFLSVDSKAYINHNAVSFHFTPSTTPIILPPAISTTDVTFPTITISDSTKLRKQIQKTHTLFEAHYSMIPGVRNSHLYILARFFRLDGIPEQVAIDYLVFYYADPSNGFPASEITKTVQSAYKNK